MPTSVGPKTVAEDSLVFAFDQDYFPHGWGLEQLAYNPTFEESGTKPSGPSVYSSGNYLGAMTQSIMQGGTFSYTGGDLSNYYSTNPEWRGWDNGGIGSTGGNWVYFNDILPLATSSLEDYIVDVRLRFVYVSLTGNGSTNPYVQIGRAYNSFKSIYYNEVGTDFKRIRFKFNGAQGNNYGGNNRDLTFGCTSADAMVEMDHFYVYRINKSTGLKDLTGNSTIDLTNASFNTDAQLVFDGTNDSADLNSAPLEAGATEYSIEAVFKPDSTKTQVIWEQNSSTLQNGKRVCMILISDGDGGFNGQSADFHDAASYTTGSWHHWIITMDTTLGSNKVKVYTNGTLEASGNPSNSSTLNAGADKSSIGKKVSTNSEYFDGEIALVKVYNRVLSASEVKANYNAIKGRFNI